eukprot:CAMPEP_0171294268 /NCGR_PEP_ID=MMETSP0816-20121228/2703_1 /TAXON_ID=420281 /ORGANISM="Proboscia inermis, Strain CCAP1064/1" /LENGTH=71 /DNA_ID=CAMNT_0011765915 /DNA_START=121 /DNA_END=333 /DNA_ORIENTATION=+
MANSPVIDKLRDKLTYGVLSLGMEICPNMIGLPSTSSEGCTMANTSSRVVVDLSAPACEGGLANVPRSMVW